ncbi:hypothetical protein GCM10027447_12790 [Glycomyces halotolerans]
MTVEYAVALAASATAFGPLMLMCAVLWWPLHTDRRPVRRAVAAVGRLLARADAPDTDWPRQDWRSQ